MTLSHIIRSVSLAAALLATLLVPQAAQAYYSDAALERDGSLCTHQIVRSERKYGIPQRLLGAVAATETGQWHKGLGVKIPWPWVINVEGKPFFFNNKNEAVAAVARFQSQGISSIDVGCMQINLHHHPDAFANLNQAFEPSFNVDYAARFLRGHYDEAQSWKTAVGRYHSRTPAYATRYISLVYGNWYGLTGKVASARAERKKSRYKSYVRVEASGKQVDFSGDTVSAPRVVKAAKPKTEKTIRTAYDLNIIRPQSSAGKIASAPTRSEGESPLVMHKDDAKTFTNPKVLSISVEGGVSDASSPFIRFVD
jgi:hypothetical protein